MRTTMWAVAAAMLSVAMPAHAQDAKVEGNIGGGYSVLTGEARQHTGDGGVFEIGVTYSITPIIGVKAAYNYTGLGKEKTVTLPVTNGGLLSQQVFSADAHMHDVTFDVVLKAPGNVSPYGLIGPGIYHRTVNVTTPAVGLVTICDPFWFVCYPAPVGVDQVIGSRSSTDAGLNVGGGVSFKVGERARLYFEVRYVYIWGPDLSIPAVGNVAARTVNGNGQVAPFTFGVRW
jgi:opacity protein-like surface antigen